MDGTTCQTPISICCQDSIGAILVINCWKLACATGWHANFDSIPSRKRGRPLVKWDDKLSNITNQFFPLRQDGLRRPNCLFGKMRGNSLFHILWASRSSFSPCPYGIVVVVFHFDSGGRKAKQSCFSSVCRSSAFPWSSDVPFQNPAGPTFQTQTCNIGGKISILLLYMWQTKVSARRSPTTLVLCCSTHVRFRAMVMAK